MQLPTPAFIQQTGLERLEFTMVLVVMAFLWLMAFNRLQDLQEIGEKTKVEMTIRNIRSGLHWEMSDRIMTAREASIGELAGTNPVRWLEKIPENYLGEFSSTPEKFPRGSWYFDTSQHLLQYRPSLGNHLICVECQLVDGEITLGWRIEKIGNPMFGRSMVKLVELTNYRWF
ncbi:MAG: hypothetical protein HY847_12525 [Betaproteobacteria bacterium]|nr:hypothetical protein [Betaproteobacteria bacterium]